MESTSAVTTQFSNIANNVVSQIAAAMAPTDVSVSLLAGTGASFPNAPFYCSCEYEVMWCITKAGDILNVQRGVDGTLASGHPINSIIQIRNNAGLFLDAYDAIKEVDVAMTTGAGLPANVAYTDKTQELTHKTIDLSDPSKQNTIIGTVAPDPSQLVYQNILFNGGFEDWYFPPSLTLAAGTPTSGGRSASFTNGWVLASANDSLVTGSFDVVDADSGSEACCLLNISTIQANDVITLQNTMDYTTYHADDFNKWYGNPLSLSVRLKILSGNIQVQIAMSTGYAPPTPGDVANGAWTPLTNSYQTYKLENVHMPASRDCTAFYLSLRFKGVGQVCVDNVMMNFGTLSTTYRPRIQPWLTGVANRLVNGGCEIWQRGTSFNQNGGITADKWQLNYAGGVGVAINRGGVNQPPPGSSAFIAASINLPANITSAGFSLVNKIEDFPQLMNKVITLTGWLVSAGPGGTFMVRLAANSTSLGAVYSRQWVAPSDGGWHRFVVSMYVPIDITFLQVEVQLQAPLTPSAVLTLYVDNFQLVDNMIPAEYNPLTYGEDLGLCLRYYEIIGSSGSSLISDGYMIAGTPAYTLVQFKATKAVAPTVTFPHVFAVNNCSQPTNGGSGVDLMSVAALVTALGFWQWYNNLGAAIILEANP